MEENKNEQQFNDEEESGFDIKEWLLLFLHYWYLFVIFVVLALGAAYLKNRKWIPKYQTQGTLMIEEAKSTSGSQVLMQGFGVQSGFRNIENQIYMLKSYDFISRVVDSMPSLTIDYITKGRFKVRNRYADSPIKIETNYIDPGAYGILFKISVKNDGSFVITDDDGSLKFEVKGKFNQPLQNNLFFLTIFSNYKEGDKYDMYFTFRNTQSLVADFINRLNVEYLSDGASVLATSLISETPQRDVDFIDKMSETYLSENLERKNDAANKTMSFIDDQLSGVKKDLEASEGAMTNFRQSNQIVDLTAHSTEVLGKATTYDEKQNQIKLRESYINYISNYLKTNLEEGSIVAPSSVGVEEPMLIGLVQQFNQAINERNEITDRDPSYPKFTREIENLKKSINEVIKNMRASLSIEKKDLSAKLSNVKKEIISLPQKEMEMVALERKYRVDDNYYTFFLQKRAEAAIQKASNSPDNSILDKARYIGPINSSIIRKTYLTYGLIGFLLPLLIIVLMELMNNTIRGAKDVEKNSQFTLIGSVRHTQSEDPLLAANRPRSSFTEMFRVIRTRVEFIVQRKNKISVLITSSESGDGKTYFSTNLASVYGLTGLRTLLVDMDIRKPSINGRLSLTEKNGVTNYLIGESPISEYILKKDKFNFDLLLAGTVPPNPGELIRSEKLKDMFKELKGMYDYIIVDTSPIGLVADAYSLAPLMDTNILIVRSEKTNKSFFKKLNYQLKTDNIKNFFVVINDVKVEQSLYGKYNSSKYGYGYGYGYGISQGKRKNEYDNATHYYEDDKDI